jgi:hypothetical protein
MSYVWILEAVKVQFVTVLHHCAHISLLLFFFFFFLELLLKKVLCIIYEAVILICLIQMSLLNIHLPGNESCKSGNERI